jgi:type IV secretory pathway VirB4 component
MQVEGDDLYHLYIYISVYADNLESLKFILSRIESLIYSMEITSRRATYRNEQTFQSVLPLFINHKDVKGAARRNVLTSGLSSTYPFISSELCDSDGVLMGYNYHNSSLVIVDRFDTSKYKNANEVVLGTTGSGKSYKVKLDAERHRMQGTTVMIIDPDREYKKLCQCLGGTYVKLGPSSSNFVNIMDIRKSSFEDSLEEGQSLLASKIQKLHAFFSLVFSDITPSEKSLLDDKLIQTYELKGINFDDSSLLDNTPLQNINLEKRFKQMPLLSDLYELLEQDPNTKRLATLLKPMLRAHCRYLTNIQMLTFQINLLL